MGLVWHRDLGLGGVEGEGRHGHEKCHAHDQPRQHQDHQQLPTRDEEVGKSGEYSIGAGGN